MQNLKTELQAYFNDAYPDADICTEYTVFSPVHIRFELGGAHRNGTKKRVAQATERALTLFRETFAGAALLWVLVYDYGPCQDGSYLYSLLDPATGFEETAELPTRMMVEDEHGNSIPETLLTRLVIVRQPASDIRAREILNGIANNEMGFEPKVPQRIIFFDPTTDRAFLMYDDRGCYVWSNEANRIRDLYINRNDWMVDYHRTEIDQFFS